ncbi:kinase-like protein, partial [Rozella allomycis CSF55]
MLIYICMEYCENGDLGTLLTKMRRENTFFDEDSIWKMFTQIVLALHECHHFKNGAVLHRDLKPENILLDKDLNVKLSDFGLSCVLKRPLDLAKTYLGTPYYMSPEQVDEKEYNVKSDIWSLGCLLYEMCELRPPFNGKNETELWSNIKSGRYRLSQNFSNELHNIIRCLLKIDPNQRPTTDDLIQHPIIKLSIREQKFEDQKLIFEAEKMRISQREKNLAKKEAEIEKFKEKLLLRENEIKLMEKQIAERMQMIFERENTLLSIQKSMEYQQTDNMIERRLSPKRSHLKTTTPFRDRTHQVVNTNYIPQSLYKTPELKS